MGHQLELFEERAAIMEFDAGLPHGIAEARAHKETIVVVPFALACDMARIGWSFGKMIRYQHRQGAPLRECREPFTGCDG